jgi:hypothetical protein
MTLTEVHDFVSHLRIVGGLAWNHLWQPLSGTECLWHLRQICHVWSGSSHLLDNRTWSFFRKWADVLECQDVQIMRKPHLLALFRASWPPPSVPLWGLFGHRSSLAAFWGLQVHPCICNPVRIFRALRVTGARIARVGQVLRMSCRVISIPLTGWCNAGTQVQVLWVLTTPQTRTHEQTMQTRATNQEVKRRHLDLPQIRWPKAAHHVQLGSCKSVACAGHRCDAASWCLHPDYTALALKGLASPQQ